jgi:hypothetical protein
MQSEPLTTAMVFAFVVSPALSPLWSTYLVLRVALGPLTSSD